MHNEVICSVSWMVPAISGGLSRTLAVVCVEPLEFLKTQAQARMPGGLLGAIRRVGGETRIHGVLYMWKGVYTHLLRDISFSALHWLMSAHGCHDHVDWKGCVRW